MVPHVDAVDMCPITANSEYVHVITLTGQNIFQLLGRGLKKSYDYDFIRAVKHPDHPQKCFRFGGEGGRPTGQRKHASPSDERAICLSLLAQCQHSFPNSP